LSHQNYRQKLSTLRPAAISHCRLVRYTDTSMNWGRDPSYGTDVLVNDTWRISLMKAPANETSDADFAGEIQGTKMEISQEQRTDQRWFIVTLLAWGLISALLFVRMCVVWGLNQATFNPGGALIGGGILTFVAVSLPFRILQNVIQPERRTGQLRETVWCVIAFLSIVYTVISIIISFPPNW
jgi:hypothetical protein